MKFRNFVLSSGKEILLGKSAENNDVLVEEAKRGDLLLHTSAPGSPFVNLGDSGDVKKEDLKEAAVYCAKFSQDWRDNRKDVLVHSFLKADTSKEKGAKAGSWKVNKIKDKIKVKKADILKLEKEIVK